MNNKIDQVKNAENEAVILLNHAMALAKASTSSDELEIVSVLDSNLKLWVEKHHLKVQRICFPKILKRTSSNCRVSSSA